MKPVQIKRKNGEVVRQERDKLKKKRNFTLEKYMSTRRTGDTIKQQETKQDKSDNSNNININNKSDPELSDEAKEKKMYIEKFLSSLTASSKSIKYKKKIVAFVLRKSKEYDVDYLEKILESLKQNINVEVEYVCLSDIDVSKYCKWLKLENEWGGWWSKLELFTHPYLKGKDIVYFDLDTVIKGDITPLITYDHSFSMLRDFYFDHRFGSGVMAWSGDRSYISKQFDPVNHPKKYITSEDWGDQAFIRDHVNQEIEILQDLSLVNIMSYKVSRKKKLSMLRADIVCFHGKPRPREVRWKV